MQRFSSWINPVSDRLESWACGSSLKMELGKALNVWMSVSYRISISNGDIMIREFFLGFIKGLKMLEESKRRIRELVDEVLG